MAVNRTALYVREHAGQFFYDRVCLKVAHSNHLHAFKNHALVMFKG